jgi:hypothetical protein
MNTLEAWHHELLRTDPEARKSQEAWQQQREANDAHRAEVNRELDRAAQAETAKTDWHKWQKKVDESGGDLAIVEMPWFRWDVPGTAELFDQYLRDATVVVHKNPAFLVVRVLAEPHQGKKAGTPVLTTQDLAVVYMNIVDGLRSVPRRPDTKYSRSILRDHRSLEKEEMRRAQRSMDASRRASEGFPVSQEELRGDY